MAVSTIIAVDALGGDYAPDVVVDGVLRALAADEELGIILCGPEEVVTPVSAQNTRCSAMITTESIAMDEPPAQAVRKKKDSSLVVGCRLVKEGAAAGFFSAGSTGACLASASLNIGRVKGVVRPMLGAIIPTPKKPVLLCDVGANADCRPEYLIQFAKMAVVYCREVLDVPHPKIGYLNIGEEESKGSEFAQEVHASLRKYVPEFIGNAQGSDIMSGSFDAIVTDGFTGNVCLKTMEGTAKTLLSSVKGVLTSSPLALLGSLTLSKGLKNLKQTFSSDTYGGAPLIGIDGACVIGHGSSNALAIANGILTTARIARADVSGRVGRAVVSKSEE